MSSRLSSPFTSFVEIFGGKNSDWRPASLCFQASHWLQSCSPPLPQTNQNATRGRRAKQRRQPGNLNAAWRYYLISGPQAAAQLRSNRPPPSGSIRTPADGGKNFETRGICSDFYRFQFFSQ